MSDLLQDRPALSRWHPKYAAEFGESRLQFPHDHADIILAEQFMKSKGL